MNVGVDNLVVCLFVNSNNRKWMRVSRLNSKTRIFVCGWPNQNLMICDEPLIREPLDKRSSESAGEHALPSPVPADTHSSSRVLLTGAALCSAGAACVRVSGELAAPPC